MTTENPSDETLPLTLGDAATILFDQTSTGGDKTIVPEHPGVVIGNYTLLEQVGEGGFGTVWKAEQHEPVRRMVALKIIKLGMDTREVIARFEQERQALAMMEHSGIARVLDAGTTVSGRPFFVMELVAGVPITKFCDTEKLAVRDRLALFLQVCAAIQHAHQKGIIHRDIKPSNLLVARDDNGAPVVKVIDFGIAKATAGKLTEMTLFTEAEQMIGTPAYMSPEQAGLGNGQDLDTRCDIYALGVVLYELLTGRTPFDPRTLLAAGYEEMRRIIREQEPPRPSTRLGTLASVDSTTIAASRSAELPRLITTIKRELDWVVMKAIEKERSRRYETANGLAGDIERFLRDEPVAARPPSSLYRLRKFVRRHRAPVMTATAIALALVAGITFYIVQIRAERDEVRRSEEKTRLLLAESLAQNAELSAQRGQWQQALAQWDEALAAGHPNSRELRIRRVEALTVEEHLTEARAEMAALDAEPLTPSQRAKLNTLQAEDVFLRGETEEGIQLLRAIPPEQLPPAESAYVRGLLSDNTTDALAAFREAVTLQPYHHRANLRLCALLLFSGLRDEARTRANAAAALFPQDYMLRCMIMQVEKISGNEVEAARMAETLKDAPAGAREAMALFGSTFASMTGALQGSSDLGQAQANMLQTLSTAMGLLSQMKNLGNAQGMKLEKYGAPYFSRAMSNYYQAAMKHFMEHNQREGLVAIDKAMAAHRIGDFFFLKGLMLMEQSEFAKARQVFEEGMELPGTNPQSQVLCRCSAALALTLADPDNPENRNQAYAHYEALLKVPNLNIIGAESAAMAALNAGDTEAARAWYALLPKAHPMRAQTIAFVESAAGDHRAALEALQAIPEGKSDEAIRIAQISTLLRLGLAQPQAAKLQRTALAQGLAHRDALAKQADDKAATPKILEEATLDFLMAANLHEALGELEACTALLGRCRKWLAALRTNAEAPPQLVEFGPNLAEATLRAPLALSAKALAENRASVAVAAARDGLAALAELNWLDPQSSKLTALKVKLEQAEAKAALMLAKQGKQPQPPVESAEGEPKPAAEPVAQDVKGLSAELETTTKAKGPEHRETIAVMISLAAAYGAEGSGRKSIKLGEEALALARRVLPSGDPLIISAIKMLITNYRAVDLTEEAQKLQEELKALVK